MVIRDYLPIRTFICIVDDLINKHYIPPRDIDIGMIEREWPEREGGDCDMLIHPSEYSS